MNEKEMAIKIEQLKNEKAEKINALRIEILNTINPRMQQINEQMKKISEEYVRLQIRKTVLENEISFITKHFDQVITAYQLLFDTQGEKT